MITSIEALNFRSIRYIKQPLKPFQILIGANASGKSNFLDILSILGRTMSADLATAIGERTEYFHDLIWRQQTDSFELAVESRIPEDLQTPEKSPNYDTVRYEIAIGLDPDRTDVQILNEQLTLIDRGGLVESDIEFGVREIPETLFIENHVYIHKNLISDYCDPELRIYTEQHFGDSNALLADDYLLPPTRNPHKTILSYIVENERDFPVSSWFVERLTNKLFQFKLDSSTMRQLSRFGEECLSMEYGASLPAALQRLKVDAPDKYKDWLMVVQTAVPDLEDIIIEKQDEDSHLNFRFRYADGLELPSGVLSEGILRLLVLTSLAYIPEHQPICVIEHPENNLHPLNLELVVRTLHSIHYGQVIMVTHSPQTIDLANPRDILVFSNDEHLGTQVVVGEEHPNFLNREEDCTLAKLYKDGDLA